MRNPTRTLACCLALLGLLAAAPLGAQSTDSEPAASRTAVTAGTAAAVTAEPARDLERANVLRAQAQALRNQPSKWEQAAWLHARAARLRSPTDPLLLDDLTVAAGLLSYNGEYGHAAELMEELADRALAVGDLMKAANSYITAAITHNRAGRGERALALVEKARLLTHSPLLSEYACDCILARIVESQDELRVADGG